MSLSHWLLLFMSCSSMIPFHSPSGTGCFSVGSLCSSTWRTSSPSFTDFDISRAVSFTSSHSFLRLHFAFVQGCWFFWFFSVLNFVKPWGAPTVADGLSLGQRWVCFGALALSGIREDSTSFSQKPPLQPRTTKTYLCKPNTPF